MSNPAGFSVRIFIPSGEPEALRFIEKSNWTGQGLIFPRALFAEARQRPEIKRTGVYILWGPGESGQLARLYVGEGDPVLPRLDQHAKNKDFWTHAAVFTSKDQNLNKAHIQHLESRLIAMAKEAKKAELDNGNVPQLPALSEADAADAEGFLGNLLLCLPVAGVSYFEKARAGKSKTGDLFLKAKGIEARGVDTSEGFIVRAGSFAVIEEVASIHSYASAFRKTLREQGVLEVDVDHLKFTQDYTFNSSSTAASVLLGNSTNGRTSWKDTKGNTLKQIQDAEIEAK